ncbi:hypothetical protein RIF29_09610 [Crotalaria pallida]|uniref:Uncharacterized protein n=1 Tax=Crotalaria pallida TaxID=3830 RepID=A0AAN9IKL3_CROPI
MPEIARPLRVRLHSFASLHLRGDDDVVLAGASDASVAAEMQFKEKWIACLSFGEQTFHTITSDQEKKLHLEHNGPRVARVSVLEVCSN